MSNKKVAKKQEQLKLEQQRLEEQQRHEQQRHSKEAKLKELAQKSSPLLDYELLDAYEFFLLQLAAAGIPQGNIYEFAAQIMLKFEKGKNKRRQQLWEVERTNEEAVKVVNESMPVRSRSRVQRQLRPQLMPFKGEISEQELSLLGRK